MLYGLSNKVKIAIQQLKDLQPEDGFYLANSGGKDSAVIRALAMIANIKFDAHYHMTTIDPKEITNFLKNNHEETKFERPKKGFFSELIRQGYPTRQFRWCCKLLKERGAAGRFVILGIRKAESAKRSKRKNIEFCIKDKQKKYLNLIINWSDQDVWQFIRSEKIKYCELYDEGFKRIGCILCPLNRDRLKHVDRWPRMIKAYQAAFNHRYKYCQERGLTSAKRFKSGIDMFNFWLYCPDGKKHKEDQLSFFEDQ